MITTKQRAKLKSLAHNMQPHLHIGKEGLTDVVLEQIELCLSKNELIKLKVLPNCDLSAKEVMQELIIKLKVEPVQSIGFTVIIFKISKRKDIHHIEY